MGNAGVAIRVLLIPLVLALSACRPNKAPLESPHSAMAAGSTAEQIGVAVRNGLVAKRWNILEETPGAIVARVTAGGHSATVRVRYDASGWTIDYVDSSEGLLYEEHPSYGTIIHHRYNLWVRNLDSAIRTHMTSPAPAPAPAPEPGSEPADGWDEPAPAADPASAEGAPTETAPAEAPPAAGEATPETES